MSVRAYKLLELKTKQIPTFNLGELNGAIENLIYQEGNIMTVHHNDLLDALVDDAGEYSSEEINLIGRILQDFAAGEETIDYYIY